MLPTEPQKRDEAIKAFYTKWFPPRTVPATTAGIRPELNLTDTEIMERAYRGKDAEMIRALFERGDISAYNDDESRVDAALAKKLWFYSGGDRAAVERLFSQSALGQRSKWRDRPGYRQLTLDFACDGDVFTPGHRTSGGANASEHNVRSSRRNPPPPMPPEAFHGIAGEVVSAIAPHTEACREAVLTTLLIYMGNCIGRGPHAIAEGDRHGTNLFVELVGETGRGRKGTSQGRIRHLATQVDPSWANECIKGGMASGEGLLWHVRDPIEQQVPLKEKGRHSGEYELVIVDHGVADKRLIAYEPEFASVLKVMSRDTNTLSTQVRQAWDDGNLRTMTKNNPATATGAHISILGHITKEELLRHLTETEAANGFANRFLWIYTYRSQLLPEGGGDPDYRTIIPDLKIAIERARGLGRLDKDDETREAWAAVYPDLSRGEPGLFGAVTARAEAQVLRLSVLYAALDGDTAIRLPHLKAALAVWEYAEASARYIFGDRIGDLVADRIVELLSSGEKTRTEIRDEFNRHESKDRIDQALDLLLGVGRIRQESRQTGGKPLEVWTLVA